MTYLPLTAWQRRRLQDQLRRTTDARVHRRTFAILEFDRGRRVADIAQSLHVSRQSVYGWLGTYTATRQPTVLADARRSGRPTLLGRAQEGLLQSLLGLCPQELGLPHAAWSAPLLRETMAVLAGVDVSARTVRRALQRLDYTWKRPRYVLAADPLLETRHGSLHEPGAGALRLGRRPAAGEKNGACAARSPPCQRAAWCWPRMRATCCSSRLCARAGRRAENPRRCF